MRDERGRFLPGQRPVGRAEGKHNKVTEKVKEKFQQLVDSYTVEQMKMDLMELEPADRLRIISGLLDFFIPKLNRTDHALQGNKDIIIVQLPGSDDIRPIEPKTIQQSLPPIAEG